MSKEIRVTLTTEDDSADVVVEAAGGRVQLSVGEDGGFELKLADAGDPLGDRVLQGNAAPEGRFAYAVSKHDAADAYAQIDHDLGYDPDFVVYGEVPETEDRTRPS